MQVLDIFGILTNGKDWVFYRFEQGTPDVFYEIHEIDTQMILEHEDFATQVENLLSATVGVLSYQVRGRQVGGVKRDRDAGSMEECQLGIEHVQDGNTSKRPSLAASSNVT